MTVTYESHEVANDTLVTTAETVIATLSGVNTPRKTTITLKGWLQLTTGAATTGVTLRVRRGTAITDTLIDEANVVTIGAAAGGTEEFAITATDEGVDLAGGSYVLTAQQAAATGNGTALQGSLSASMPS